jgi:adenine-specific DNA-methyltransferase
MSKIVLSENFSNDNWHDYFDSHSDYYAPVNKKESQYNDDTFTDVLQLGLLEFTDGNEVSVHLVKSLKPLTERSFRRKQFEKAVFILKEINTQAGLFIFYDNQHAFRFSLVYPIYKGVKREYSSFRRFSFYIREGIAYHTYEKQIGLAILNSIHDIKQAFALEPVTKEFYTLIAVKFSELVGGERKIGGLNKTYKKQVVYPESNPLKTREFAVRLIGRLIFCWFLKK